MKTTSSIQKSTLQGTHFSKVPIKKAQNTAIVGQVHVNIHHFSCTLTAPKRGNVDTVQSNKLLPQRKENAATIKAGKMPAEAVGRQSSELLLA